MVTDFFPNSGFINEKGSKVEADEAMCPLLSLLCREENRDGDTYVPFALHNYRVGQVVMDLGWVDLDLVCFTIRLGQ